MDRAVDRVDRGRFGLAARLAQYSIVAALLAIPGHAQFVTSETAVPRTSKPPVVFLNGYQFECPGTPGTLRQFRATFASSDEILQRNGQPTLFFDTCALMNYPALETVGIAFGEFLSRLRYQDGQPVLQVDVVAHSMGGLILRSYLAGKQTDGTFNPPADTRIRKIVFLGTPHIGTSLPDLFSTLLPIDNAQIRELRVASNFLFDLATWNQGADDLRGIDAMTVLGNAGNASFGRTARFDDSTASLSSGSLDFIVPGRTRIVNYCHTSGLADGLCTGSQGYLAQMTSESHESARAMLSFLNGTQEWLSVGEAPANNVHLMRGAGLVVRARDAMDRVLDIQTATAGQTNLSIRATQAYTELLPAQQAQLTVQPSSGSAITVPLAAAAGATRIITIKPGPSIKAVYPSAAAVFPRTLAPGMFVSIYGMDLATTTAQAPGLPYPTVLGTTEVRLNGVLLPLHYAGPAQVNAVIPDNASGLAKLQVRTAAGEHTVNVLIEPAVPALFQPALNAITGIVITADSPLRPGDYISLFLTGLGPTERRDQLDWAISLPQVTIGGKPCALLYAGRAPGYIGLDQINCRLAADVTPGNAAEVVVRSRNRVSNTTRLPVR